MISQFEMKNLKLAVFFRRLKRRAKMDLKTIRFRKMGFELL